MSFHPALHPVGILADRLVFGRYPFASASVVRAPEVPATAIADVDPTHIPPTLRTHAGELLFVPPEQADALVAWARGHGVAVVDREDAWMWLLEPFLDTESGPADRQAEYDVLATHGFDRAEVDALRREVARAMNAYVAITWDWAYLGLWDVLMAKHAWLIGWVWRPGQRRAFYERAMAIALRAPTKPLST